MNRSTPNDLMNQTPLQQFMANTMTDGKVGDVLVVNDAARTRFPKSFKKRGSHSSSKPKKGRKTKRSSKGLDSDCCAAATWWEELTSDIEDISPMSSPRIDQLGTVLELEDQALEDMIMAGFSITKD